jgi:PPP family 3-phenylpropionic acid transporter
LSQGADPHRGLVALRLYYFASFAAFGAYAPFFPRWLEARGVRGLSMGAVAALLPALGVLGPPAAGIVADALGLRGSILRVACAGACLSIGALGLAGALGASLGFALIFGCMFVYAAFRSPMVMLADVVAMERAAPAGTTYGALRLWGSVGFLAAAALVGRVLDVHAAAPLPLAIAALLAVTFLAAWPLPAKPDPRRLPVVREAKALIAAPDFRAFLAACFLGQLAHSGHDLCLSLHLRDRGASDATAGLGWALGVVVEVVLMARAERLVARFGPPRLVVFALAGASLRWTLLAVVTSLPVLLALQPLHAISFALWWVASLAQIKARAPVGALATAQGLYSAVLGAGSVAGMLAWGALYRRAGGTIVFGAAAVVAAVATITAASWASRLRYSFAEPTRPR